MFLPQKPKTPATYNYFQFPNTKQSLFAYLFLYIPLPIKTFLFHTLFPTKTALFFFLVYLQMSKRERSDSI